MILQRKFIKTLPLIAIFLALPVLGGCVVSEEDKDMINNANKGLRRFVLDNGATCLIREDHSAPVVSIQVWIGTGAIHEGEHLGRGLSHAVEHMIFKGTQKRGPGDIAREIASAGGSINAYTSFDRTVFHADMPSRNWRKGLEIIADALMNSAFDEAEWEKERKVILREIAMGKDSPGRVLGKLLWRTAYTTHPYMYPVIGYRELFSQVTRDMLFKFFKENYISENAIIVVVGDFDPDEAEQEIRQTIGEWQHNTLPPRYIPDEPSQLGERNAVETGAYKVTRLEWVYHTVALNHPDAVALDVLANIVGQGRSSRLVKSIKEDKKLVHSIDAWSYTPKDPGLFGISATFAPEKKDEVISAINDEISAWFEDGFSDEDVKKAGISALRSAISDLETMKGQASAYASGEFYAGNPRFTAVYLERLNKITGPDVLAVARKYLLKDNRTIAILAPEGEEPDKEPVLGRTDYSKPVLLELDNGTPLIFREDRTLPFVYFCFAARGGLLSEYESSNGITKFMSELLTRGTGKHTSEQIAEILESKGASLSSFSGRNSFGLNGKWFADDSEAMLKLAADCLLNPSFNSSEIEKQRDIQIAQIVKTYEKPFSVARKGLREMMFAGHPYQWSSLGTRSNVMSFTRKDLRQHRDRLVVADNVAIAIFGDISQASATQLANRYFRRISTYMPPDFDRTAPKRELPSRRQEHEPKQQAIILMGLPAMGMGDPGVEAFTLLQKSLNGMASHLFSEVRNKRGLAYYVGAFEDIGIKTGSLIFYAGTKAENIEEVQNLFFDEIDRIVADGLTGEELERARNKVVSKYEMGLQNNLRVARTCVLNHLYGLGYQYMFSTPERFSAVTSAQVRQIAEKILKKDQRAVSIVLPETE